MTTVDILITRLQNDFDCRLTTSQILSILNTLERRLAVDIVRKTQTRTYDVEPGKKIYELDVDESYVTRVFVNGREIQRRYSYVSDGYICEYGCIVFSEAFDSGEIYIEYLVVPDEIYEEDITYRTLFLGYGHDEIYLYHILSREALMSGNIDMLNNYSLLYAEALNALKAEIANAPKGEAPQDETPKDETPEDEEQNFIATSYKNIW
ncbi:MAG: hypothetical protein IJ027_06275 [Oscillospiraceae bacterium]|nr:hypothetical protein [Oscillospiraceae bacterium]